MPVGRLHGPTPPRLAGVHPGKLPLPTPTPAPGGFHTGPIRAHPRKSISSSLPLRSVLANSRAMDLDEPWLVQRGEAVAVLAAGVVAEPDLVLSPIGPTNAGAPLIRELGHRRTANAPHAFEGHGHGKLRTKRLHGETRRTSPGAGARWDDLKPDGYGWMTVVTSTLLG